MKIKDIKIGKWIRNRKHIIVKVIDIINLSPFSIYIVIKNGIKIEFIIFQNLNKSDPLDTEIKNNKIRRIGDTPRDVIEDGEESLIEGLEDK